MNRPNGSGRNATQHEAVYLSMKRTEDGADMQKVSPFLIKKKIDYVAGSEVLECKKLRNGTLMIKCINKNQAEKLMKITSLCDTIKVKVEIHQVFNKCKGRIYSRDLCYLTDEEILEELKGQHVIEIQRIKRKDKNGRRTNEDNGLYILTFSKCDAPEKVLIGYEQVAVSLHIPLPLRCYNCFQFGHVTAKCTINHKSCPNCNKAEHTEKDAETGIYTKCNNNPECANCHQSHNSFARTCSQYQNEFEIQRIRATNKISYMEAKRRFKTNHPLPVTFSEVVQNPPSTTRETSKRTLTDSSPSTSSSSPTGTKPKALANLNTLEIKSASGKTVTLLPKNITNAKLQQIKGNLNKKARKNSSEMSMDSSDD